MPFMFYGSNTHMNSTVGFSSYMRVTNSMRRTG